jgi:hypothetical protein
MLKLMDKVDTWWLRNVHLPLSWNACEVDGQPDVQSAGSSLPRLLGLVYDITLEHHQLTRRRLKGLIDRSASSRDATAPE